MRDLLRRAAGPGDLLSCALLPAALASTFLQPGPASHSTLARAGPGLVISAWLSYWLDLGPGTGPVYTSHLPHLAAAGAGLLFSPPPAHTYTLYWAVLGLRPLTRLLLTTAPRSFSYGEAVVAVQTGLLAATSLALSLLSLPRLSMHGAGQNLADALLSLQVRLGAQRHTVIALLVTWAGLVGAAVWLVQLYTSRGWQVTTRTRKLFHLLVVTVYTSGLLVYPLLLLLASWTALAAMLALETVRVSRVFPALSDLLTHRLTPFLDEKDRGPLILTNIYLLVGVSWPLWLSPAPTAATPAPLPLYCGVLAVGVLDSAASLAGSWLGRLRWPGGGGRTVEGSLAGLAAAGAAVWLLSLCGVACPPWTAIFPCLLATSLCEALTGQVDNLTLPLVMLTVLNATIHFLS